MSPRGAGLDLRIRLEKLDDHDEWLDLDVWFVPDGTSGFEDLQRDARAVARLGVSIPVASLADLVRSKRAAGREKDASHLPVLLDFIRRQGA